GVIISIFAIVGPEYDAPVLLQIQYKKYGVDEKTGADSTLFQAESFFWLNAARAIWAPVLGGVILLMKEHPGSLRILDQHGTTRIPLLIAMAVTALLFGSSSIYHFSHLPKDAEIVGERPTVRKTIQQVFETVDILRKYVVAAGWV